MKFLQKGVLKKVDNRFWYCLCVLSTRGRIIQHGPAQPSPAQSSPYSTSARHAARYGSGILLQERTAALIGPVRNWGLIGAAEVAKTLFARQTSVPLSGPEPRTSAVTLVVKYAARSCRLEYVTKSLPPPPTVNFQWDEGNRLTVGIGNAKVSINLMLV